jgi:hypothetical protein
LVISEISIPAGGGDVEVIARAPGALFNAFNSFLSFCKAQEDKIKIEEDQHRPREGNDTIIKFRQMVGR